MKNEDIGSHIAADQANDVPPQLKASVTEKEIEAVKRHSLELASMLGVSMLSIEQKQMATAAVREAFYLEQLRSDCYTQEDKRRFKAGLAESLFVQGRYTEAMQAFPSEQIQAIIEAIECSDDQECACPETTWPRHSVGRVYSIKHSGWVYLLECAMCGHKNARPSLQPKLQLLEGLRADRKRDTLADSGVAEKLKHV